MTNVKGVVHHYSRLIAALGLAVAVSASAEDQRGAWEQLEPGLELGTFVSPLAAESGDSRIHVLRIDPQRFELRLLNASASPDGKPATAREWCERNGLVAAINASLFQADYRTSVALMKTQSHTNNTRLSKDNAVLVFDRLDPTVPPVQIVDRTCQNFDEVKAHYGALIQSIRMVSCDRKNVWSVQDRKWSTAAIGIDLQGRVILIHVRSPYATHDLIESLLNLPIDLHNAMYLEGGPQAQLYVGGGGRVFEFAGMYEGGFMGTEQLVHAWPIPNVLAVARVEEKRPPPP